MNANKKIGNISQTQLDQINSYTRLKNDYQDLTKKYQDQDSVYQKNLQQKIFLDNEQSKCLIFHNELISKNTKRPEFYSEKGDINKGSNVNIWTEAVYDKLISTNILELSQLDNSYTELFAEQRKLDENVKAAMSQENIFRDYQKGEVTTGQIVFAFIENDRNNNEDNGMDEQIEINKKAITTIKYTHSIRVSHINKIKDLKVMISEYYSQNIENISIISSNFQKGGYFKEDQRSIMLLVNDKKLIFEATSEKKFSDKAAILDKSNNKENNVASIGRKPTFDSKFNAHFPRFANYFKFDLSEKFQLEEQASKKIEPGNSSTMTDYHYLYLIVLVMMLCMRLFITLNIFQETNQLQTNFGRILSAYYDDTDTKFGERAYFTRDFNTTQNISKYFSFLASTTFANNIQQYGEFKIIGLTALRVIRTKEKTCAINFGGINNLKCYYQQYEGIKKSKLPIYYTNDDVMYNMRYGTTTENRISNTVQGYFTPMDGSGYLLLLDQEDAAFLKHINEIMNSMALEVLNEGTKGILISVNQNYVPLDVNITSTTVFELSPFGNWQIHPNKVDMFILDFSLNRQLELMCEILLVIICFVQIFFFVNLLLELERDEFMNYLLFTKFGILNLIFTVLNLIMVANFIEILWEKNKRIDEQSSNQNIMFYYEDFSPYYKQYHNHFIFGTLSQSCLIIRQAFVLTIIEKGSIIINSQTIVSGKTIIIQFLMFGTILTFSVILCHEQGPYEITFNTLINSFLSMTIFTLRNNVFQEIHTFSEMTIIIIYIAYIFLITLIGCMMQIILSETVRVMFIYRKISFLEISERYLIYSPEYAAILTAKFENCWKHMFCKKEKKQITQA